MKTWWLNGKKGWKKPLPVIQEARTDSTKNQSGETQQVKSDGSWEFYTATSLRSIGLHAIM